MKNFPWKNKPSEAPDRIRPPQATSQSLRAPLLALAVASLLLTLSGCGTVPIDLRYQPSVAAPPPSPTQAKVHVLPVVDATGGPDSYGGDINEQMGLKGPLSTHIVTPYTAALKAGLEGELSRLAVPVVAQRGEAEALLEASLTKTLAYVKSTGMTDVPVYGAFEFGLALKCADGAEVWRGEFNGYGKGLLSAPGYLRVGAGPNDAMNAAFADAMEQVVARLAADNVLPLLARQCRR